MLVTGLTLHLAGHPVNIVGNVGVDPGQVGPRTANAPADEADDLEPAVDGHHEGAPAVPLAAVPALFKALRRDIKPRFAAICELIPHWANGAILLVPMTPGAALEAGAARPRPASSAPSACSA